MTRSPLLFAVPLFAFEAVRVCLRSPSSGPPPPGDPVQLVLPMNEGAADGSKQLELPMAHGSVDGAATTTTSAAAARGLRAWVTNGWRRIDKLRLIKLYVLFALPVLAILAISLWHNQLRFGDPFEVGYRYLTVAWRDRMEKWGLFHYHYLARNLAVVLTSLPWWPEPGRPSSLQINAHGLALWLTTPVYLWLLWPRKVTLLGWALWLTVIGVGVPSLLYQNTGWLQFGYRFSNDYSVFLFALLAIGGYRFRALFWGLASWAVVVNALGALTFGRPEYQRFYYQDASQRTLHQPD